MSGWITFGAIIFGVTLGVLVTYWLLHFTTDMVVAKKMSAGDVEGVKKVLGDRANRVSQQVRITAEVWIKQQQER